MIFIALAFTACSGGSSDSGDSGDAEAEAADSDQVYELKFSIEGNDQIPQNQMWQEWAKKVEEATDGHVKCQFYFDATLLASDAAYQQLVAGVADIGDIHRYSSDGFNFAEKWKGFTLGTPSKGQIDMTKQLFEEFPALADEYAKVKILAYAFDGGAYQLLTVNKKVEKAEDLKGMVIWCEADFNDFFKELGVSTVNTPFSEVYSSLQKNMYDGMFIAAETLDSCNFADVCKYVTMVNMSYLVAPGHLMNLDTWNSLPEEYQNAIMDPELVEWVEQTRKTNNENANEAALKWAPEAKGTEIIEFPEEEHQKLVDAANRAKEVMVKDWDAKGLPGTDILNRMIELSETTYAD